MEKTNTKFVTNNSEFAYQLSLHASKMLFQGIASYAKDTEEMLKSGDDPHYCFLRADTCLTEARRLQKFCKKFTRAGSLVSNTVNNLELLMQDLEEVKEKYYNLYMESLKDDTFHNVDKDGTGIGRIFGQSQTK